MPFPKQTRFLLLVVCVAHASQVEVATPDNPYKPGTLDYLIHSVRDGLAEELRGKDLANPSVQDTVALKMQGILASTMVTDASWMDDYAAMLTPANRSAMGFHKLRMEWRGCGICLFYWPTGVETVVHSHGGKKCVVKVLHGSIQEWTWNWDKRSHVVDTTGPFKGAGATTSEIYGQGEVTSIDDNTAIHVLGAARIGRKPGGGFTHNMPAWTLHVYVPPGKGLAPSGVYFHPVTLKEVKYGTPEYYAAYPQVEDPEKTKVTHQARRLLADLSISTRGPMAVPNGCTWSWQTDRRGEGW